MPTLECPHCRREQTVPREMFGLEVRCQRCGREFTASADADPEARRRRADEARQRAAEERYRAAAPGVSPATILKTAGLLGGLLLVLGVVIVVAVLATRPASKPDHAAAAGPTARGSDRPAPPSAGPPGGPGGLDEDWRARERKAREALTGTAAVVIGLLVLAAGFVYVLLLFLMGAWVAKDANARGMPGLGWASFYYLFHAGTRVLACPLAALPGVLVPGAGLAVLFAVEVAAWVGLFVYLYARRPGRLAPCWNCNQRHLAYLATCPICGQPAPRVGS